MQRRLVVGPQIRDRPDRSGFTILELLVSITIIALLLGLLLPAIGAAREAAHAVECRNNLKQIGLALHSYHEFHGSLPAGWQLEESEVSGYAWAVPLLPLLERNEQFTQINRAQPVTVTAAAAGATQRISLLICPSDVIEPSFALLADSPSFSTSEALVELPTASYVGVFGTFEADEGVPPPPGDGAFIGTRPVKLTEFEHGLSSTFLVGERTMERVPSTWLGIDFRGEDAACRIVGNASTSPNRPGTDECEFCSRHPEHSNFLWGDGHVSAVASSVEPAAYRAMACRFATVPGEF